MRSPCHLILRVICISFVLLKLFSVVECDKVDIDHKQQQQQQPQEQKPQSAKPGNKRLPKDPLYITELDLENLYDQWEETDEEKLPPDELEPHKRPASTFKIPKDEKGKDELFKDPEKLMIASKKGKTLMVFVNIAGKPTREQTEELTARWQIGLGNNHMRCERYVIDDDRVIFVFHDGSLAFVAKDFLLDQPELKELSIDQRTWHGKGYPTERPHTEL
jgi:hypothetical protein